MSHINSHQTVTEDLLSSLGSQGGLSSNLRKYMEFKEIEEEKLNLRRVNEWEELVSGQCESAGVQLSS